MSYRTRRAWAWALAWVRRLHIRVPVLGSRLAFGAIWLIAAPLTVWGVRAIYVPIIGGGLGPSAAWWAATAVVALIIVSVALHALGHILAARVTGSGLPSVTPIYPLGDSAQVWPEAGGQSSEALSAIAGPVVSLLAAGAAFLVWNVQLDTFVSTVCLFLLYYNLGLAALNSAPVFPFDGARLVRAVEGVGTDGTVARWLLTWRGGLFLIAGWVAWAAFLASQRLRFSVETSGATLVLTALAALSLGMHRRPDKVKSQPVERSGWARRTTLWVLPIVVLALAGVSVLPLPTNSGMEAPGIAAPIGPMVHVPADKAYPAKGALLLTTVVPQAPIAVAEWVYARLSPDVRLTSPAQIVPANTTAQDLAIQGFRDLQASEKTATVVGLQLAGFQASLLYTGAEILQVEASSLSKGILRPGDQITAVDGTPVTTVTDVSKLLDASPKAAFAELGIDRNGQTLTVQVPLMRPSSTGSPPRIGILVGPTSDRIDLPFPVSITPEKITGGPSAGLMFALAVYNAVTPTDLTKGRTIAGTGTIDLNGNVGPIGGVEQKVAGAEQAGATYFLCPVENYPDAIKVAHNIKIVEVATIQQALQFLQHLPPPAS